MKFYEKDIYICNVSSSTRLKHQHIYLYGRICGVSIRIFLFKTDKIAKGNTITSNGCLKLNIIARMLHSFKTNMQEEQIYS